MNYPMKDGQIDPEFLKKVREKADNTFFSEVEDILLAAQQVMVEMQPEPVKLEKGDAVTHNLNPKWGKGTVNWISKSGKQAKVHFELVGWSKALVKNLTKVEEV